MKCVILYIFFAACVGLISARPTFDKIAEALLDVLDVNTYPRYPAGSPPNYQDGYHLHHHDHHYYGGGGAQQHGYYQNSNIGYPAVQQSSYPSEGPYPQAAYPQRPYPHRPYYVHGNNEVRRYDNKAPDVSVQIIGTYPPSGYQPASYEPSGYQSSGYRHHGYK